MDIIPLLEIIALLLGGSFCMCGISGDLSRNIFLAVLIFNFSCSAFLFFNIGNETIFYSFGGWSPEYGIRLRVDRFAVMVSLLPNATALISVIGYMKQGYRDVPVKNLASLFGFLSICVAGLSGLIFSNDLFNIYVFIEISSISCYIAASLRKSGTSLVACLRYLVIGSVGATLYLIGIGFILSVSGNLNIDGIREFLAQAGDSLPIRVGGVFLLSGLALKAGLFPMHRWVLGTYSSAPEVVASFFAGTISKVNIYLIFKLLFLVFPQPFLASKYIFSDVFLILLIFAAPIPAFLAALEKDRKKLLSYSCVSQTGGALSCLFYPDYNAVASAISLYVLSQGIAKTLLFLYTQPGAKSRMGFFIFIVSVATVIGMPPTIGFLAKISLLTVVMSSSIWLTVSFIVTSVLTVLYCYRLFSFYKCDSVKSESVFAESCLCFFIVFLLTFGLVA